MGFPYPIPWLVGQETHFDYGHALNEPIWFGHTMHYKKSWFFKRFNLTKMSTMIKKMFTLAKGMRHERHMVLLVGYFDLSDHFDQVLSRTSSKKGQFFKMVHQDTHGLVKLTILNGHV